MREISYMLCSNQIGTTKFEVVMRRDKHIALSILQVLESRQGAGALGLPEFRDVYLENVGAFGEDVLGHLYLMIDSGILLKSSASEFLPASIKMTWGAYDLLDELKKQLFL